MGSETSIRLSCDYNGCEKTFSKQGPFNQHRKTHERPHKCSLCDKSFGLKTDRDRHRTTHKTDVFNFKCKFPGCTFKGTPRKDYLLKHMRLSHQRTADPATKKHLQQYYQQSSNEEIQIASEEDKLRFLEAVSEGNECLVEEYLSRKIDVSCADSKGTTAGDIAVTRGQGKIMQLLIKAGIDVNSNKGNPWLAQAFTAGNIEIAKCLLEAGADLHARTIWKSGGGQKSSTVFDDVIIDGDENSTRLLLKYKSALWSVKDRLEMALYTSIDDGDLSLANRCMDFVRVEGTTYDTTNNVHLDLTQVLVQTIRNADLEMIQRLCRYGMIKRFIQRERSAGEISITLFELNKNNEAITLLLGYPFGINRMRYSYPENVFGIGLNLDDPKGPGCLYYRHHNYPISREYQFIFREIADALVELGAYSPEQPRAAVMVSIDDRGNVNTLG